MPGTSKSAVGQFWAELRRRRVIRTTIAYVVVAWLTIEVASTVFPALLLPAWTVTLVTVLVILALPAVVMLAWIYDIRGGPDGPVVTRTAVETNALLLPALPAFGVDADTVAVLPFETHAGEPERAYLAQSMAAELHQAFSRIPRLRVVSRVSSFAYSGVRESVRRIGQSLGARFIVSGAVTSIGEQLRVTVAIDDANAGTQVWTRSYDGTQDGVLDLLQRIAGDAAGAFGGVRLEDTMRHAQQAPAESLDAWTRVQRARAYLLNPTPGSMDDAIALLEEAVRLEPDYAVAAAALASVLGDRASSGLASDLEGDGDRALDLANRAADLAPGDPFVLKLAGGAAALFGDVTNALQRLRRATQLAPFDLGAWGYLGWPLAATGNEIDLDELHAIMSRMLESAPEHPGAPYWLLHRSVALSCAGKHAEAANHAARAVEQNPRLAIGWFQYCNALAASGDTTGARGVMERAARTGTAPNAARLEQFVRRACNEEAWRRQRTAGIRSALPELFP